MAEYKHKLTSSDALCREYEITISADAINNKLDEVLSQIRLKGFRPNRSPPIKFLRERFGASYRGEVIRELQQDACRHVVEKEGIKPVFLERDDGKEKGNEYVFSMSVEVCPEFVDVDLSKISIPGYEVNDIEKRAQAEYKELTTSAFNYADKAEGAKVEKGDVVFADFEGKIDGQLFRGGNGKNTRFEVSAGKLLPDFEKGLLGMKVGEEKTIKMQFPEDYGSHEVAGKKANMYVKIIKIQGRDGLLDVEELAKNAGYESADDFSKSFNDRLQSHSNEMIRDLETKEVFDKLAGLIGDDVPPSWFKREADTLYSSSHDTQTSYDEFVEKYRDVISRRVKLGMYLMQLADAKHLKVGDADIASVIMRDAGLFNLYRQNQKQAAERAYPFALERKSIDYILSEVKRKTESVGYDELIDIHNEFSSQGALDGSVKSGGKKPAAKKIAAATEEKKTTAAKEPAAKPAAAKVPAAKKATAAKEPAAKAPAAKKATTTTAAKKTTAAKAPAAKPAAKKTTAAKPAATKAAAKPAAKKATATKTAAKKTSK